jgi:hypothetical protein
MKNLAIKKHRVTFVILLEERTRMPQSRVPVQETRFFRSQPLMRLIWSNALQLLLQNTWTKKAEYLLDEDHDDPWYWLEQHCNANYNAITSHLCVPCLEATLQSENDIMMRVKQHLKRTSNHRIMSTNPQVFNNLVLITRISNQARWCQNNYRFIPPIKNPVHAKKPFFSCTRFW